MPHEVDWPAQVSLREFLSGVRDRYDLVLIDVPPNLHLCCWAALVASDALVVPLQPEDFGAQGIVDVRESVERVQAGPNPGLRLLGYIVTMHSPRRAVHQVYVARLREIYGDAVFAAMVPEAVDFVEAIAQRKPIAAYKPKGAAAKAIRALADELLARLAAGPRPRRRPRDGQGRGSDATAGGNIDESMGAGDSPRTPRRPRPPRPAGRGSPRRRMSR